MKKLSLLLWLSVILVGGCANSPSLRPVQGPVQELIYKINPSLILMPKNIVLKVGEKREGVIQVNSSFDGQLMCYGNLSFCLREQANRLFVDDEEVKKIVFFLEKMENGVLKTHHHGIEAGWTFTVSDEITVIGETIIIKMKNSYIDLKIMCEWNKQVQACAAQKFIFNDVRTINMELEKQKIVLK
jgi:hypothetical protein